MGDELNDVVSFETFVAAPVTLVIQAGICSLKLPSYLRSMSLISITSAFAACESLLYLTFYICSQNELIVVCGFHSRHVER